MDILKDKIAQLYNICKDECYGLKEASTDIRSNIKRLYGYEIEGEFYYNDFNIMFSSIKDANFFANLLPRGSLLAQMLIPEYNEHLLIYRYSADAIMTSILG